MNPHPDTSRVTDLIRALDVYRQARQTLLNVLGLPLSNRDPLAEFSEHLVAALTGAVLASSRVQADYDLTLDDGNTIQVRYLANPSGTWVNEHVVRRVQGVEWYALVLFEALTVIGVLAVPTGHMAMIARALGKRHAGQDEMLQLTQRNWCAIRDNLHVYKDLGARVWLPPFT